MATKRYEMPELDSKAQAARPQVALADKQARHLLIALVLLLVVLAVVVVNNRDFWFGSDEVAESAPVNSGAITKQTQKVAPAEAAPAKTASVKNQQTAPVPAAPVKNQHSAKPAQTTVTHEVAANPEAPVITAKRIVLPPLDVEVVAGDSHRMVHSGSNIAIAQIPRDSNRTATLTTSLASLATNAAERERLSPVKASELRQTIDSTYPLLGQHSRVQGSVVLEAVVGADGVIESLRVLSGPAILSTAAQQAVREWRFKPVLQNGQPVETKARITVNFTIRISDNPEQTS